MRDSQDLGVFHVVRKKEQRPCCSGFLESLEWWSVLHKSTGWDSIQPHVLFFAVDILFCVWNCCWLMFFKQRKMDQLLQTLYTKCVKRIWWKAVSRYKKESIFSIYIYMYVYLPSVWLLENISYLFTDENSGSKQAQIVLQQCKQRVWSKA